VKAGKQYTLIPVCFLVFKIFQNEIAKSKELKESFEQHFNSKANLRTGPTERNPVINTEKKMALPYNFDTKKIMKKFFPVIVSKRIVIVS